MKPFDPTKIDHQHRIGQGASGVVVPYNETGNSGNEWVVKYQETYNSNDVMLTLSEIVVGSKCHHPNVLSLKACYIEVDDNRKWYICAKLPRMKTDLNILCESRKNSKPFDRKEIVKYFYGIILGLEHLHLNEIAHRDIKPANVLLDKNDEVKLADFGAVVNIDGENSIIVKTSAGTKIYMAPEVEANKPMKNKELYKADMWSLGVTMAKLCLGLEFDTTELKGKSGTMKEKFLHEKLSEQQKIATYGNDLLDLIKSLIQENSSSRPNVQQARGTLEAKFSDILGVQIQQHEEYQNEIEQMNHQIIQEKKEEKLESQVEEKKIEEPKSTSASTNKTESESIEKRDEKAEKAQLEEMKELKKYLDKEFKKKFKFRADPQKFIIEEPNEISNGDLTNVLAKMKEFKDGETYYNLKGLALRLTYCPENLCRSVTQFVTEICRDCKDLTLLELNFWESKTTMTDALIKAIAKQIGDNLTNLKELGLNLSGCDEITPTGVNYISNQILPNLTQLKTFQLKLSECSKVGHDSAKELFAKIGHNLRGLKTLNLYLEGCDYIKDDTLAEIKAQFSSLKGLNSLLLSLSNCKNISSGALHDLCKGIKHNLEHLNSLHLAFCGLNVSNETKTLIDLTLKEVLKGGQNPEIDY